MNDIHISICVITYNHEGYISKALDSILEQNFNKDKIEIVIGVDKSSDGTSKIVDKYHKKHQKIIYPLYHKKNIGMMANFIDTIKRCKGKYIALCEGDDYWTFNQKLLQQFNFMNSHEQYSFCFHNAIVIHEHCNKETSPFTNLENRDYEGCEVIEEWKIPTASVFFRNTKINWPHYSLDCAHGDILLFLLLLKNGSCYGLDQKWSTYRRNESGITVSNARNPIYVKKIITQLINMQRTFSSAYKDSLSKNIFYWKIVLLNYQLKHNLIHKSLITVINLALKHPKIFYKKSLQLTKKSVKKAF